MEHDQKSENLEQHLIESGRKIEYLASLVHNLSEMTRSQVLKENLSSNTILSRVEAKVDIMALSDPSEFIDASLDEFKFDFEEKYDLIIQKINDIEQIANKTTDSLIGLDGNIQLDSNLSQEVQNLTQNFNEIRKDLSNINNTIQNFSANNISIDEFYSLKNFIASELEANFSGINEKIQEASIFINNFTQLNNTEEKINETKDILVSEINFINQNVNNQTDSVKNEIFSANQNIQEKIDQSQELLAGEINSINQNVNNQTDSVKNEIFSANQNIQEKIDQSQELLAGEINSINQNIQDEFTNSIKKLEIIQNIIENIPKDNNLKQNIENLELNFSGLFEKFFEYKNIIENTDHTKSFSEMKSSIKNLETQINDKFNNVISEISFVEDIKKLNNKLSESEINIVNQVDSLKKGLSLIKLNFNGIHSSLKEDAESKFNLIKQELSITNENLKNLQDVMQTSYGNEGLKHNIKSIEASFASLFNHFTKYKNVIEKIDNTESLENLNTNITTIENKISDQINALFEEISFLKKSESNNNLKNLENTTKILFNQNSLKQNIENFEINTEELLNKFIEYKNIIENIDNTEIFEKLNTNISNISNLDNKISTQLDNILSEESFLQENNNLKSLLAQTKNNLISEVETLKINLTTIENKLSTQLTVSLSEESFLQENDNLKEHIIQTENNLISEVEIIKENLTNLDNKISTQLATILSEESFLQENDNLKEHIAQTENNLISEVEIIKENLTNLDNKISTQLVTVLCEESFLQENDNLKNHISQVENNLIIELDNTENFEKLNTNIINIENQLTNTLSEESFLQEKKILKEHLTQAENNLIIEVEALKEKLINIDSKFAELNLSFNDDLKDEFGLIKNEILNSSNNIEKITDILVELPDNTKFYDIFNNLDNKLSFLSETLINYENLFNKIPANQNATNIQMDLIDLKNNFSTKLQETLDLISPIELKNIIKETKNTLIDEINLVKQGFLQVDLRFDELQSSLNIDTTDDVNSVKQELLRIDSRFDELQSSVAKNTTTENVNSSQEEFLRIESKFNELQSFFESNLTKNTTTSNINPIQDEFLRIESRFDELQSFLLKDTTTNEINLVKQGLLQVDSRFDELQSSLNIETTGDLSLIKNQISKSNDKLIVIHENIKNIPILKDTIKNLEQNFKELSDVFSEYKENANGSNEKTKDLEAYISKHLKSVLSTINFLEETREIKKQIGKTELNLVGEINSLKNNFLQIESKLNESASAPNFDEKLDTIFSNLNSLHLSLFKYITKFSKDIEDKLNVSQNNTGKILEKIGSVDFEDNFDAIKRELSNSSDKFRYLIDTIQEISNNKSLNKNISNLEEKMSLLSYKFNDYKDILEGINKNQDQTQTDLKTNLDDLKIEISDHLKDIIKDISFLEEAKELKQHISEIETNIIVEIGSLKQNFENLDTRFEDLKFSINSDFKDQFESLKKDLANLSQDSSSKLNISDIETKFDDLKSSLNSDFKDQLESLKKELTSLSQNNSPKLNISDIETKFNDLKSSLTTDFNNQFESLKKEIGNRSETNSLLLNISDVETKFDDLKISLTTDFKDQFESLKEEIGNSSETNSLLLNISDIETKFEGLNSSLNSKFKDQLTSLKKELSDLSEDNSPKINISDIEIKFNELKSSLNSDFKGQFDSFKEEMMNSSLKLKEILGILENTPKDNILKQEISNLENKLEELFSKSFEYKNVVENINPNEDISKINFDVKNLGEEISQQLKKIIGDINFIDEIQLIKNQVAKSEDNLKAEINDLKTSIMNISQGYSEIDDVSFIEEQDYSVWEKNDSLEENFTGDLSILRDQIAISNNKLNELSILIKKVSAPEDIKSEISKVLEEVKFLSGRFSENLEDLKEDFEHKITEIQSTINEISVSDSSIPEDNNDLELNHTITKDLNLVKEQVSNTNNEIAELSASIINLNDSILNGNILKENFESIFEDIRFSRAKLLEEVSSLSVSINSVFDEINQLENVSENPNVGKRIDDLKNLILDLFSKNEIQPVLENLEQIQDKINRIEDFYKNNHIENNLNEYVDSIKNELNAFGSKIEAFKQILDIPIIKENKSTNELLKEISILSERFNDIWAAGLTFDKMTEQISATQEVTENFQNTVNNFIDVFDKSKLKINDILEKTDNINSNIETVHGKLTNISSQISDNKEYIIKDILLNTNKITYNIDIAQEKLNDIDSKIAENSSVNSTINTNIETVHDKLDNISHQIIDNSTANNTISTNIETVNGKLDNIGHQIINNSSINNDIIQKVDILNLNISTVQEKLSSINSEISDTSDILSENVSKRVLDINAELDQLSNSVNNISSKIESVVENSNSNKKEIQDDLSKIDLSVSTSENFLAEKLDLLVTDINKLDNISTDNLNSTDIIKDAILQIAVWIDSAKDLLEETNNHVIEIKNNNETPDLLNNLTSFIDELHVRQTEFIVNKSINNYQNLKEQIQSLEIESHNIVEKLNKVDDFIFINSNLISNNLNKATEKLESINNTVNQNTTIVSEYFYQNSQELDKINKTLSDNTAITSELLNKNLNNIDIVNKNIYQNSQELDKINKTLSDNTAITSELLDKNLNNIEIVSKNVSQNSQELNKINKTLSDNTAITSELLDKTLDKIEAVDNNISKNIQELDKINRILFDNTAITSEFVDKGFEKLETIENSLISNNEIVLDNIEKNIEKTEVNAEITSKGFELALKKLDSLNNNIIDGTNFVNENLDKTSKKIDFIDKTIFNNTNALEKNLINTQKELQNSLYKIEEITDNKLDGINNTFLHVIEEVSSLSSNFANLEDKINNDLGNLSQDLGESLNERHESHIENFESKLNQIKKSINLELKKMNDRFTTLEGNIYNIEGKLESIESKQSNGFEGQDIKTILEFISGQVAASNENTKINNLLLNRIENLEKRMSGFDNNLRDLIDILKEN